MIVKPPILYILGDPDGPVSEVCRAATPAEVLAHPAVAALVAERGRLRATVIALEAWSHVYGAALCPPPGRADSYGDGVRDCKAAVLDIICAATRAAKETT